MQLKTSTKDSLAGDVMLAFPDFDKEFIVSTDASGIAIAAILSQEVDGFQKPICICVKATK